MIGRAEKETDGSSCAWTLGRRPGACALWSRNPGARSPAMMNLRVTVNFQIYGHSGPSTPTPVRRPKLLLRPTALAAVMWVGPA